MMRDFQVELGVLFKLLLKWEVENLPVTVAVCALQPRLRVKQCRPVTVPMHILVREV